MQNDFQVIHESAEGLLDRKKRMSPKEYAQMLRSYGPVSYWATNGLWVVTDYEIGKEILKTPQFSADRSAFFISRMPNMDLRHIGDFFGVVGKMMVMSDAPDHVKRRKAAALGLNDALVDHYRSIISKTVDELIEHAEKKGFIEFVSDLALPLPSAVLADLFHIPKEKRADFYRWSNNMTQFFGGASQYRNEDGIEVNQSALALKTYFSRLMDERRQNPQDDFLSIMVSNQHTYGLSDDEVVSQAIMMLVAGSVTTTDQLCNNMYTLINEPQALKKIREDLSLLPTAIEELNRLDPGVSYLFRSVKEDISLKGYHFKTGETVFISNHAVNRDPSVFNDPDVCNIERNPNPHFAYGHGSHYCIGAKLARIQMMTLFTKLLERYPMMSFDQKQPPIRRHYSLAFSGFETITIHV